MASTGTRLEDGDEAMRFSHPVAFWFGTAACFAGVALHLPMYVSARDNGYRLAHMAPDLPMIVGMVLIGVGLGASLYGLVPRGAGAIRREARDIRVAALDDAPIRFQHIALLVVMTLATTIDVMKPTTLSFVAPGVAQEYGLRTAANPHGHLPVSWLPLVGITGTVVGSLVWGWLGDRTGRRASILFAGVLFMSTSVCGAMPGFEWNLLMCFVMGIGAGGMLPITFALLAETIPARHRGWLVVLIGGDVAGAYVATSWLAGALTPHFGWRILWLLGAPTGLLLLVLNRWIPESPRYLLAAGRRAAAVAVMRRYGATVVSDADRPPGPRGSVLPAAGRPWSARGSSGRSLIGPTAALGALAIAAGLLTYGFQFWVPTNLQRLGLTAVTSDYILRDSALLGLPLTVLVALLYGFWSSRHTILCLSVLTLLGVVAFAVWSGSLRDDRFLLTVLLTVPLSGIGSVIAAVTAYSAEIYPTRVRSRGTGLVAGMTKAGGVLVLGLVVAAATTPSIGATALIGVAPLAVAVVLFAWTAPETARRGLEELSFSRPEDVGSAGRR